MSYPLFIVLLELFALSLVKLKPIVTGSILVLFKLVLRARVSYVTSRQGFRIITVCGFYCCV